MIELFGIEGLSNASAYVNGPGAWKGFIHFTVVDPTRVPSLTIKKKGISILRRWHSDLEITLSK